MTGIFLASWFAQSLGNWRTFNAEQRGHSDDPVSRGRYLLDPDFWEKTLQNWQSEFLAVGVMVVVHDLFAPAWLARIETRRGHRTMKRLSSG